MFRSLRIDYSRNNIGGRGITENGFDIVVLIHFQQVTDVLAFVTVDPPSNAFPCETVIVAYTHLRIASYKLSGNYTLTSDSEFHRLRV